MTIINHSHRFVFVHVPKAAGTSVTGHLSELTNYCDLEIGGTAFGEKVQGAYARRFGITKHSTARDLRAVMGHVTWAKYFKFAVVRNPFERCVSSFHFLRKWMGAGEFGEHLRRFETFEEYVLSDLWGKSLGPDNILRPQMHWLRAGPTSTSLLVDYVCRVETLAVDLKHVYQAIGLRADRENSLIPHLNKSKADIAVTWNEAIKDRIIERYMEDFEVLNYSEMPSE